MRRSRIMGVGLAMVLAAGLGCAKQTKTPLLNELDVEQALTPGILVGRWRGHESMGFPQTLAFSEVDGVLSAKFMAGDNSPLTFKGIRIENAKVHCYIDSGPLNISRPRSDFYFRVSKDRQRLEYNEKPSGESGYYYKRLFKRLPK